MQPKDSNIGLKSNVHFMVIYAVSILNSCILYWLETAEARITQCEYINFKYVCYDNVDPFRLTSFSRI